MTALLLSRSTLLLSLLAAPAALAGDRVSTSSSDTGDTTTCRSDTLESELFYSGLSQSTRSARSFGTAPFETLATDGSWVTDDLGPELCQYKPSWQYSLQSFYEEYLGCIEDLTHMVEVATDLMTYGTPVCTEEEQAYLYEADWGYVPDVYDYPSAYTNEGDPEQSNAYEDAYSTEHEQAAWFCHWGVYCPDESDYEVLEAVAEIRFQLGICEAHRDYGLPIYLAAAECNGSEGMFWSEAEHWYATIDDADDVAHFEELIEQAPDPADSIWCNDSCRPLEDWEIAYCEEHDILSDEFFDWGFGVAGEDEEAEADDDATSSTSNAHRPGGAMLAACLETDSDLYCEVPGPRDVRVEDDGTVTLALTVGDDEFQFTDLLDVVETDSSEGDEGSMDFVLATSTGVGLDATELDEAGCASGDLLDAADEIAASDSEDGSTWMPGGGSSYAVSAQVSDQVEVMEATDLGAYVLEDIQSALEQSSWDLLEGTEAQLADGEEPVLVWTVVEGTDGELSVTGHDLEEAETTTYTRDSTYTR